MLGDDSIGKIEEAKKAMSIILQSKNIYFFTEENNLFKLSNILEETCITSVSDTVVEVFSKICKSQGVKGRLMINEVLIPLIN
jgi:hypothetical protein